MRFISLAFLGFPLIVPLFSQEASIQDCLGAIPVCQEVYVEDRAPIGFGNTMDYDGENVCLVNENNSIWYTFTVNQTGQFGFVLTPTNPLQDYDWILFDITDASCGDLLDDPSLVVSCNAAGGAGCSGATGATGATIYNDQGPNCGTDPPNQSAGLSPFNELVDVVAGNTYVLCILNFSANISEGYTLDFGLSADIGIFDEIRPTVTDINYPESCNGSKITVSFSEYIQCTTLDADNFQLVGDNGPYDIGLNAANCDAGGNFSKTFELTINPALEVGNEHTISLLVDEVSEALDLCGNPSTPGAIVFGGPVLDIDVDLGPDTSICQGESLTLQNTENIAGSYNWSDGSFLPTLEVNDAGIYSLTITTACGAISDSVTVSLLGGSLPEQLLGADTIICESATLLLDPGVVGAEYLWQDGSTDPTFSVDMPGLYAVTVTNECGVREDEILVEAGTAITASIDNGSICPGGSIEWDVTTLGASYEWNDGATSPTFTATAPGEYSVIITTACDMVTLNATVSEGEGTAVSVDLGNDTILCSGNTLELQLEVGDAIIAWQDGTSDPNFTVTTPGSYGVTVTNDCGTIQDMIEVGFAEPITAEIRDTILCEGQEVTWDVSTPGATYLWNNGATDPVLTTGMPGDYSVVVSNACESQEFNASLTTGGELPSVTELNGDTTLCPGTTLTIDLPVPADVTVLWQDGSTSTNYEINSAGEYNVTLQNGCGEASASFAVTEQIPLEAILTDTTICLGETVLFDVTNEGATYIWQDGSTNSVLSVSEEGDYTVDISNACESITRMASVSLVDAEVPTIALGSDTTLCDGDILSFDLSNIANTDIIWQDGEVGPFYSITEPGTYSVIASNECGSVADSIRVNYQSTLDLTPFRDTVLCAGESLLLDATVAGEVTYLWQDNSTEPTFIAREPGIYSVVVNSTCAELSQSITIDKCITCEMFLPNAFSPNGDGQNDFFTPFSECLVKRFTMQIFDRWGNLIFTTESIEDFWDGRYGDQAVQAGVYLYSIEAEVGVENGPDRTLSLAGDVAVIK